MLFRSTLVTVVGDHAIVRVQGSIRLSAFREPQPDLVLLRPQADFYASRLPGAEDILLIIEIAESSIEYDRDVKARMYADSGVVEYWVADITGREVVCHTLPRAGAYAQIRRMSPGESIAPTLLPACAIQAETLLGS